MSPRTENADDHHRGFIDGILDGTIENEKAEHYLRIVSDEVKRLSRLVTSMLNMSKIEAASSA
jgi:signal transduction histidine kinase